MLLRHDGGDFFDEWEDEDEKENEKGGGWVDVRFFSVGESGGRGMTLMEYNALDSVLMNHEIETYYNFEPLIVFSADTGSNFWGFDPRQMRQDGEMPVRFCDHESGDVYEQSDGFISFIRGLTSREAMESNYGNKFPDVAG